MRYSIFDAISLAVLFGILLYPEFGRAAPPSVGNGPSSEAVLSTNPQNPLQLARTCYRTVSQWRWVYVRVPRSYHQRGHSYRITYVPTKKRKRVWVRQPYQCGSNSGASGAKKSPQNQGCIRVSRRMSYRACQQVCSRFSRADCQAFVRYNRSTGTCSYREGC